MDFFLFDQLELLTIETIETSWLLATVSFQHVNMVTEQPHHTDDSKKYNWLCLASDMFTGLLSNVHITWHPIRFLTFQKFVVTSNNLMKYIIYPVTLSDFHMIYYLIKMWFTLQKKADSTFLQVCYATLWHSMSSKDVVGCLDVSWRKHVITFMVPGSLVGSCLMIGESLFVGWNWPI